MKKISPKIKNLFLEDRLQLTDSAVYDTNNYTVFYLDKGIIKSVPKTPRFFLPMSNALSDRQLTKLIVTACSNAGNNAADVFYTKMLLHPSAIEQYGTIYDTYMKYTNMRPRLTHDGDCIDWIYCDMIAVDKLYFLPDADFFGCISTRCNSRMGAFCMPESILEVKL